LKVKRDVFPETRGGRSEDEPGTSMGTIPPFYLVFTDLDGTLLDHDTYGWEAASPALTQCRERGVPIILVSSKTRAEMDNLRRRMGLSMPFISENGGGIFFPREAFPLPPEGGAPAGDPPGLRPPAGTGSAEGLGLWVISLGVSYPQLVQALGAIRRELDWPLRGFSDMGIEEISRLTGLGSKEARLAAMREYDEPFILEGSVPKDLTPLYRGAEERGLLITSGGRFYHLQGKNDKGVAMERLLGWYRSDHKGVVTIALGDSPNDFAMLERADIPVLIRSQRTFPDLKHRIPGLRISGQSGPAGWNSVVSRILSQNGEKAYEPGL
jgi:mannosyl-3-phosphoglycerate phosphatase